MSGDALERGYWHAYKQFYTWRNLARGAAAHGSVVPGLRHFAYASGWKKFEPLWDLMIRARQAGAMLPVLEGILSEFGKRPASGRGPSLTWPRVFRPASGNGTLQWRPGLLERRPGSSRPGRPRADHHFNSECS